jgi:hypothetical protein
VRLVNRDRRACVLYGYPTVELRDRAGRIPFRIRHGGDQVVTSDRPARVVVRVGRAAFVVLSKYRCDRGRLRSARTLHLGLRRGKAKRRSVAIARGKIDYCGRNDAGSTVSVSPFEPTPRAALRR